jgi:microcystin-dependent protein
MPSLFTSNGGIELPADGEQDGVWGDTVNANMQIIDRLTNGVGAVSLAGTTHTLTTLNGALSDGQYSLIVFGGSPSGTNTVTIAPNDAEKTYLVRNATAYDVVLTQGSGGDVTVPAGAGAIVYANGAGTGAAVADLTATFIPDLALAGVTASTAELNILDGATLSTAELNLLDGVTADTAELNILDGVTASTAELNILAGVTASTAELNILDGVTATTADLNILDGVTASTAELNFSVGVLSNIQTQIDKAVPSGAVQYFAMATAPLGWLKANGALISRVTYADLFTAIGTTFGAGDGSTTFGLPDLRGEFVRGFDDSRGVDTGRAFGVSQAAEILNHTHSGTTSTTGDHSHGALAPNNDTESYASQGWPSGNVHNGFRTTNRIGVLRNGIIEATGAHAHTITTGNPSTGGGTETRPRNVALLACIKY